MRRSHDLLLTAAILSLLALVVLRIGPAPGTEFSGVPRLVDGDTLMLAGERMRLSGIDAPELRQACERDGIPWACGARARDHLQGLIANRALRCDSHGRDRYGRRLALCRAGGLDLNGAMVRDGYAVAFGDYDAQEAVAREGRRGLWAGTFDAPRVWRQSHGGMEESPHMRDEWQAALHRLFEGARAIWTKAMP